MIMNMAQQISVVSGQRYAWRTITRWKDVETSERAIFAVWRCYRCDLVDGDPMWAIELAGRYQFALNARDTVLPLC